MASNPEGGEVEAQRGREEHQYSPRAPAPSSSAPFEIIRPPIREAQPHHYDATSPFPWRFQEQEWKQAITKEAREAILEAHEQLLQEKFDQVIALQNKKVR